MGVLSTVLLAVLCYAAVETVMAMAHVGEEEFVQIDPVLGYWHRPNQTITFRREGYAVTHINSAGFRGPEVPLAKPPGVVRIAFLGDSKTEAFQVPDELTFAKLIETRLNRNLKGKRCEVLNFGMSAYSTAQEYLLVREKVLAYKPDYVVIDYNVGDADENTTNAATQGLPRPYFYLDAAKALCIDWAPMQKWMSSDNARFYYGLENMRSTRWWGIINKIQLNAASNSAAKPFLSWLERPWSTVSSWWLKRFAQPHWQIPAKYGVCLGNFATPPALSAFPHDADPVVQQYLICSCGKWPVTAAIFSAINEACKASGAQLVVAGLPGPNGWQSHLWELKQIKNQARQQGFLFIDVNKAFPSIAPGKQSPLYFKTHFTTLGHQVVADALFGPLFRDITCNIR